MLFNIKPYLVGLGCALLGITHAATSALALDLSLVSGGYKQEKQKNDGVRAGSSTAIQGGARIGDRFSTHQGWYGDGLVILKTFDGGDNTPSPDNYTGLNVGGGYRLYLMEFNKQITPYIGAGGAYVTDKQVAYSGDTTIEKTTSGLRYNGFLGMRFDIDRDFFFELESVLFDSALFTTEKEERKTSKDSTKTEKTRLELYVDSRTNLFSTLVAFGFKI